MLVPTSTKTLLLVLPSHATPFVVPTTKTIRLIVLPSHAQLRNLRGARIFLPQREALGSGKVIYGFGALGV